MYLLILQQLPKGNFWRRAKLKFGDSHFLIMCKILIIISLDPCYIIIVFNHSHFLIWLFYFSLLSPFPIAIPQTSIRQPSSMLLKVYFYLCIFLTKYVWIDLTKQCIYSNCWKILFIPSGIYLQVICPFQYMVQPPQYNSSVTSRNPF